jgi:hypothetical protein
MTEGRPGVDSNGIPYRIDGLRSLTDAELDEAIGKASHTLSAGDILDEAGRRQASRQATLLVRLTWAIAILTGAVVLMAVILLVRT